MHKTCSLKDFLQINVSQLIINLKNLGKYLGWTPHLSHKQQVFSQVIFFQHINQIYDQNLARNICCFKKTLG